eukprot:1159097-Pelagomonas_calceolata.AAC.9
MPPSPTATERNPSNSITGWSTAEKGLPHECACWDDITLIIISSYLSLSKRDLIAGIKLDKPPASMSLFCLLAVHLQMRDIVAGIKLDKSSSALERVLEQLNTFNEHAAGVVNAVTNLEGSEEAVSEVMVAEEGVDRLVPQVCDMDTLLDLKSAVNAVFILEESEMAVCRGHGYGGGDGLAGASHVLVTSLVHMQTTHIIYYVPVAL